MTIRIINEIDLTPVKKTSEKEQRDKLIDEILKICEGEKKEEILDEDIEWKIHYKGYNEACDNIKEKILKLKAI